MRHAPTHARDVPDEIVEIVADAVRLCRAADGSTTAKQVVDDLQLMHPEMPHATILRSAGYAAMLLDPRRP